MDSPRRRNSERTRDALIEAAARQFAERGFDGVRVEQIARAAGVNKAMISYHFGGKRGLYRAILRETFDRFNERLASLTDADRPAVERVREFAAAFAAVAAERPALPAMLLREALSGGAHLAESDMSSFVAPFA